MALNLDDLIGSLQHVHAGDRGQGIEEMRENLRATLGQDALGPQGTSSGGGFASMARNVSSSSMNGNGSAHRRKGRDLSGGGGTSGGGGGAAPPQNSYRDETMFYEQQQQQQQQQQAANDYQYGQSLGNASTSSGGSYNTTASSGAGSSGFGWNAQVPANTPQQAGGMDQNGYANGNQTFSNTSSPTSQPHTPSSHSHYYNTRSTSNSPRKLVNGFHTGQGPVTTPTQQSTQANVGQW